MAERENVMDLEFKWGQKMEVDCLEKAQLYESFTYDGTQYTLYDCVYMYKEGEPEPYIGKLIRIWETVDKTKKVNVQWFFRPIEILKWLGDQTPMQKEIFLATGEGIGLSNVNPLEAIAGKCYVVCTSEDSRNRQPSEEETKLADHIFYRTFDVGLCTILDKMDDSVGGLEVKYVFNREESGNMSDLQTYGSNKVEVDINTVGCKGKNKLLIQNSFDELELLEICKHDKSVVIKDLKGVSVKSGWVPGESSDYISGNNSNSDLTTEKTQVCASGQRVKSSKVHSMMDGVKKVTDNDNRLRDREKLNSDALQDKPTKKARICNSTKPCEGKISNFSENSLVQADNSMMPAFACKDGTKSNGKDPGINRRGVSVAKKGGISKGRPNGNSKDRPSNEAKKVVTFNDKNAKDFRKSVNQVERTSKLVKESMLNSTSKERVNGNKRKLSNHNMSNVCATEIENEEMEQKVAQRSNIDKGGWYSAINKVKNAAQGTVLLLWNLDPKYASRDVEDIIKDAFQTICVAIRVPRTRISSPHSGQALLKFNNIETTERIYRKLSEGCLMLPNGRPLVATAAPPINSTEGQGSYFGHLVIDSIKLQGDARDAVSTSHCSQPNTIEYGMAMEWCLLQTRFDSYWEDLYKLHKDDMRRLKANLKST